MDFDASLERLVAEAFWPSLAGALAVFAYLALLARAHLRATLLVTLAREVRRRRLQQEDLRNAWGFAPRLEHYRRLERTLEKLLAKEGLKAS